MAPLVKELESRTEIQSICCITAQSTAKCWTMLGLFAITPDYDLDIMEDQQSLYTITSKCLLGLEQVFSREKAGPGAGPRDTSTTFPARWLPFIRRSQWAMWRPACTLGPLPPPSGGDMNRTLVGDLASLHFCPTPANRENLLQEGIRDGIFVTGNTVIDALKTTVQPAYRFRTDLLNTLDYTGKRVILGHLPPAGRTMASPWKTSWAPCAAWWRIFRRWNWSIPCTCLRRCRRWPSGTLSNHERIHLIPPLTPDEMHNLMARSAFCDDRLRRASGGSPGLGAACPGAAPGRQSGLRQ